MVITKLFKGLYQRIIEVVIKRLPIYYKHIDSLPVYNWFKISKGELQYLYKYNIKYIPNFFPELVLKMVFQFERLDLTLLRKKAEYQVLLSMAVRQQNKSLKFNADIMKKEIDNIEMKLSQNDVSLDGFLDYIELTFNNIGSLDPKKISTSRAFSLYHKAVERNKQLEKQYEKVKNAY